MSYSKITYSDFKEYKIRRIAKSEIKQFVWDPVLEVKILDELDDITKIQKVPNKVMPFDVYLIPRACASIWDTYAKANKIANAVYILFGQDFIYAGKYINADRIQSHKQNEEKAAFDYQILFAPNNGNTNTQYYWVKDFMEYIEFLLINRIKDSEYCANKIDGKSEEKCSRDLNMNKDKSDFADNVIELMIKSFLDITCFDYLLPVAGGEEDDDVEDEMKETEQAGEKDLSNPIVAFWMRFVKYNQVNGGLYASYDTNRPMSDHWLSANSINGIPKSSVNCCISRTECRVELYTDRGTKEENKAIYDALQSKQQEIETDLECTLRWQRLDDKKACRISCVKSLSYLNAEDNDEQFSFFVDYTQRFFDVFGKYRGLFE